MRRILTLSLILLSTFSAISQKRENDCPQKDLIRDFVKLSDSLARFMDKTKASVTEGDWEKFIQAAQNGEEEQAFDHFGKSGEAIMKTINDLGLELVTQKQKLYSAIKTDDKMTDADVNKIIEQEIDCYFADTVENNLSKLLAAVGKLAPSGIGGLDSCDAKLRDCLRSAAITTSNGLNTCIGMAVGGGGLFGFFGALFGGLACLTNVQTTHNFLNGLCFVDLKECEKNH